MEIKFDYAKLNVSLFSYFYRTLIERNIYGPTLHQNSYFHHLLKRNYDLFPIFETLCFKTDLIASQVTPGLRNPDVLPGSRRTGR